MTSGSTREPSVPAPAAARSPYELLAARADRSRPFVTSYDGPGRCIELSVVSTVNAIAKASGLLRDELGLAPGDRLSLDLPVHWQLPVWTLAGLTTGLVVGRELGDHVEARIVGPAGLSKLAQGAPWQADEVLGCACDAFGMPVAGGVPPGVLDVGIAVRAHPDAFQVERAAVAQAGLLMSEGPLSDRGVLLSWQAVLAAGPRDDVGARTWISQEALSAAGLPASALLRRGAVDPVLCSGSVVLARGLSAADEARLRELQGIAHDRGS